MGTTDTVMTATAHLVIARGHPAPLQIEVVAGADCTDCGIEAAAQ